MSVFGQVFGNLPLLQLPSSKLLKLSGQEQWDFMEQLRHNCIRLAWLQSAQSGHNVRLHLELAIGRAFLAYDRLRGQASIDRFLDMEMEHARRTNELWACFGFFLQDEIEHLLHDQRPGPVLLSILPPESQALSMFHYGALLRDLLIRYRHTNRSDQLARDTARFVKEVTDRHDCLRSLPATVEGYFELADSLAEAVIAGARDEAPGYGIVTLH